MSLKKFQRVFENKLLFGYGFACEKASIVRVKANGKPYRFLRLDGNGVLPPNSRRSTSVPRPYPARLSIG